MDVYQAATSRRTIRLFQQKPIPADLMEKILDAGRLAPSAANRQVLEFLVIEEPQNRQKLFEQTAWAGYVKPRRTPPEGKRPMAYVIVLVRDKELNWINAADAGAAMQNMILTAWAAGVGSCWIGSVTRQKVIELFSVPEDRHLFGVLALGYPAERPVAEILEDSIEYWLDEQDVLHVPKRRLSSIVHHEDFCQD